MLKIINAPSKNKIFLPEGEALVITPNVAGSGVVYKLSQNSDVASDATYTVAVNTPKTIGPFEGDCFLSVCAQTGILNCVVKQAVLLQTTTTSSAAAQNGFTRRWKEAYARVTSATGHARLLDLGDSNIAGAGCGDSGSFLYVNALKYSIASQTSDTTVKFSHGCLIGGNNVNGQCAYSLYDPRVTMTGGAGLYALANVGGDCFTCNANQTGVLSFTPDEQFDRVEIVYVTTSGNSTAVVKVDGTTLTTLNGNQSTATRATGVLNCTGLKSTITVNFNNDGFGLPICGIITWNSSVPSIIVMQAGWAGGTIAQACDTSQPYTSGSQFAAFNADLVLVNGLTINDASASTSASSWSASAQYLCNLVKNAGSDIAWVTGLNLESAASPSPANDIVLNVELRKIAYANNIPLLEMHDRWKPIGTYGSGMYWTGDYRHTSRAGATDWALQQTKFVMSIGV